MLQNFINAFTSAFFWSTIIIGFFIVKGGFNKKYLFTDNILLALTTTILLLLIQTEFIVSEALLFFILTPMIVFILFLILLLYRFFRNPNRKINYDDSHILSPADGRIIYIKELDKNTFPVSVKKKNMIKLDEITKTDVLTTPCYLVGIAMTLFDVHYNRAPVKGNVKMIKHTDGLALGLRNPDSTFVNERNTFVIEDKNGILYGVIQIAARGVRRCIATVKQDDQVNQGQIIGKIRFGSQVDLIMPRDCVVKVREGDQVYAGITIISVRGFN